MSYPFAVVTGFFGPVASVIITRKGTKVRFVDAGHDVLAGLCVVEITTHERLEKVFHGHAAPVAVFAHTLECGTPYLLQLARLGLAIVPEPDHDYEATHQQVYKVWHDECYLKRRHDTVRREESKHGRTCNVCPPAIIFSDVNISQISMTYLMERKPEGPGRCRCNGDQPGTSAGYQYVGGSSQPRQQLTERWSSPTRTRDGSSRGQPEVRGDGSLI
jgi:hypothetical protein